MLLRLFTLLILFSFISFSSCAPEKKQKKKSNVEQVADESPKKKAKKKKAAEKNDSSGATPEQLAKAKEIIANVGAKDLEGIDAKKKFKTFCATCHGFTGDLNVNGAKDLTISKISLEESVAQVYHGKGLMTPFKGILKDAEIVAVAKWIETLRK